ncbi:MAG: iron ABC transporter permease [Rhodospirillaceae bacterium]|nr:iron ABC transporter permease [Rhodospirillaceae bacterium]
MNSRPSLILALASLVAVLALVSWCVGKVWVPFDVWLHAGDDPRWAIIFSLRLPRTILGIFVGMALGLSGAALQGYTRNPLADPAVFGVSSMASLGAVMTLYLSTMIPWLVPAGGMLGAGVGVAILLGLSGATSSVLTFILAGVILNAVASAGVALALNLAPTPWAVNEIVNWLMGSLADRSAGEVQFAVPFIVAGCALLLMTAKALDALTLGETGAQSLGVSLSRLRFLLAIGTGLSVGASVAVTGMIGFVGLVAPHLLRPFVAARPGALLLPSAIAGAAVVLAGDIVARLIPTPVELKLGVAMAALGGPFFLAMLFNMRRRIA